MTSIEMSADLAEIVMRAREWERNNPGLTWAWFDVRAHPASLTRLVVAGRVQVRQRRRGRFPTFYRLASEEGP